MKHGSSERKKDKIIIYGSYPPPIGGVAIHVKRLVEYLAKEKVSYEFYWKSANISSVLRFIFSQFNFKSNIIHVFGFQKWKEQLILLILIYFFNKKIIVSILNDRPMIFYNNLPFIQRLIARLFFRKISKLIAVSSHIKISLVAREKICCISTFIEPHSSEILGKKIPDWIYSIRKGFKFLITASAFRIKFFNNQDLYGIDLSIELMKRIIASGRSNVAFLYHIPDIQNYKYFSKMKDLILQYNLQNNFFFNTESLPSYLSILNISDLFIRPTNTDGDSLSVREAIYFGVPTIASDASTRPEGTIIFKNRDVESLFEKCLEVLENHSEYRRHVKEIKHNDNVIEIIKIYREIGKV